MAHKKQGGKTSQGSNVGGKRLGLKAGDGQNVNAGEVLVRQIGSVIKPGKGAGLGRDFTIYSETSGKVKFYEKMGKKFVAVNE